MKRAKGNGKDGIVRYAAVGLGHIVQSAVLPGFEQARKNSQLVALVSDDAEKLESLGTRYRVPHRVAYGQYDALLQSGAVDAVYIGLPNHLHRDFTLRAARAGVHVLCEKPLGVTEQDCRLMLEASAKHRIRLMTAYRLHFERCTLGTLQIVRRGDIGNPRIFNSVFSLQVVDDNIRLNPLDLGGGTLYDLGVYCINAARAFFQAEPIEVFAMSVTGTDKRFLHADEMTAATLRFPDDRVATFTSSFGAAADGFYEIVGTQGKVRVESGYEYAEPMKRVLTVRERTTTRSFAKRDQFGPEIVYFSDCILNGRTPEPSGEEGFADVRVINALYHSARIGHPVSLAPMVKRRAATPKQQIFRPAVREPELIHAQSETD